MLSLRPLIPELELRHLKELMLDNERIDVYRYRYRARKPPALQRRHGNRKRHPAKTAAMSRIICNVNKWC